ncbi:hypothetical protein [Campylobacter phage CJLB-12]|nr:hypothetical protein [Campylobacter phage CJLB-12]
MSISDFLTEKIIIVCSFFFRLQCNLIERLKNLKSLKI